MESELELKYRNVYARRDHSRLNELYEYEELYREALRGLSDPTHATADSGRTSS